jgi:predicted adenine nucleotide alpha hydrolase (AANH) superfamily ATPase
VLGQEGHELQGYYYNPNIHPYKEYERRRETLAVWTGETGLAVDYAPTYDLDLYFRAAAFHESERCRFCYSIRLAETARKAKAEGFDGFTTTLLYSKYQKHDRIAEIGREEARRLGLEFLYRDFRLGWRDGVDESRKRGMYRQPYCGCVYSEAERYKAPRRQTTENEGG